LKVEREELFFIEGLSEFQRTAPWVLIVFFASSVFVMGMWIF
jgi:hypothetical protein